MNIAIIGGGAAGMMCAATMLENITNQKDLKIFLFDKNPGLGAKVIISGGGRCNVTTGITDRKILLTKYVRGSKFLVHALNVFGPKKVFDWFESQGVPLKIEPDNRVFPISNNGKDIVGVFQKLFSHYPENISIFLSTTVKDIKKVGEKYLVNVAPPILPPREGSFGFSISDREKTILAPSEGVWGSFDKLILTTGGNAYAHTGSSGDGYQFAKNLGHTITALGPSLSSFECVEERPKKLSGISFQNAKLETIIDGKKITNLGPMLFTHFGVSGPAVFALSAQLAFATIDPQYPLHINITLDQNDTFEQRDQTLQKNISEHPAKKFFSLMEKFFPTRLVEQLLLLSHIPLDQQSASITKEHRKKICHLLSGDLFVTVKSRRPGDEFVTAGGVSLDEVNPKTMESNITPGLFFAGEILNIDGVTGGFNLQSSRATGRVAGENDFF